MSSCLIEPEAVINLLVTNVKETEASLEWTTTKNIDAEKFRVYSRKKQKSAAYVMTDVESKTVTLSNLVPGEKYAIVVRVKAGEQFSEAAPIDVTTSKYLIC